MTQYVGARFADTLNVEVDTDGSDLVRIDGIEIQFEDAAKLATFISAQIFEVKSKRGDYEY